MVKIEPPNFSILLKIDNVSVTNEIISLFKENDIPMSSATKCYNPDYPYITWSVEYLVCANRNYLADVNVKTKEDFLSYFFTPNIIEVW